MKAEKPMAVAITCGRRVRGVLCCPAGLVLSWPHCSHGLFLSWCMSHCVTHFTANAWGILWKKKSILH